MKILLDENIPRKVLNALRAAGHEVESVQTLRLAGIDNSALYRLVAREFDVCFTHDAGFARRVRHAKKPSKCKLLRVVIRQQPQDRFVREFMTAFRQTDLSRYAQGADWP